MSPSSAQSRVVDQLRRQLLKTQPVADNRTLFSTGFDSLDQLLPQQGLPTGSLIEWISDGPGMRVTSIALKTSAGLLQRPGAIAIVDPLHQFCPASLEKLGVPLSRLLLVRPQIEDRDRRTPQRSESLWALEQLARCAGVSVVLTWVDRLSSTAQRRLQLAVEKSGTTVISIRSAMALSQTSWADLRFHVQSQTLNTTRNRNLALVSSRISVSLLRSKNSLQGHGNALLECNHETGDVSEILELADSTTATTIAV